MTTAYRFGQFQYDPLSHRLTRDGKGKEVQLTRKSREMLLLFLRNPDRLLSREELMTGLWSDGAVTDDALRFQVAELRKALGDGAAYIRTLPREGYRWEARVHLRKAPRNPSADDGDQFDERPRFRLVLESREVSLSNGVNIVGRDADAVLSIEHSSVSRRHARVLVTGNHAVLEDMGSKNGTYLRGKRISTPMPLRNGDDIRIGPETMVLRPVLPGATKTEKKT